MNMGVPEVANQKYNAMAAQEAKAALNESLNISWSWGPSNATMGSATCPTCEVMGGENVLRSAGDSGMAWHDANTVEMIIDYYEATLANGTPDTSFNGIVEAYDNAKYIPREPFSIPGYLSLQSSAATAGVVSVFLGPLFAVTSVASVSAADQAADRILIPLADANAEVDWSNGNFINPANDDVLWWALALIRAYDDLKDPWYLSEAEATFASVCQSWNENSSCGGGVIWGDMPKNGSTPPTALNAITNELFFQAATRLALRDPYHQSVCGTIPGVVPSGQMNVVNDTGIPLTSCWSPSAPVGVACTSVSLPDTYEGWAWAEYQWFNSHFLGTLPILDSLDDTTCNVKGHALTYNQGPIIGALLDLSTIAAAGGQMDPDFPTSPLDPIATIMSQTNSSGALLSQAEFIANQVLGGTQPTNTSFGEVGAAPGVLTEECDIDSQSGSGTCASDYQEFKGILMRYLGHFASSLANSGGGVTGPYASTLSYDLGAFLNQNAQSIWNNKGPDGELPEVWSGEAAIASEFGMTQPIQTSGLDGLIAAMWLPVCEGGSPCGNVCCAGGNQTCVNNQCTTVVLDPCNAGEIQCGSACCVSGETCLDPGTGTCGSVACGTGLVPCANNGNTYCCAPDQQCTNQDNGGDLCCGGTEGPPCGIIH
jgi:hypothetical protein